MTETIIADSTIPQIEGSMVHDLRLAALASQRGRARLCLHRDHDETVQQMLIAISDAAYIQPHRQQQNAKSYVLLDGSMAVAFFDERGRLVERLNMSPFGGSSTSIIRFQANQWHTVASLTEMSIYLEIAAGPYVPKRTEFADWAPRETDTFAAADFLMQLRQEPEISPECHKDHI